MSLPSWNDTKTKRTILEFVAKVTEKNSPDFVPPAERIAAFDHDGTLWCEHPIPVQFQAALAGLAMLAEKKTGSDQATDVQGCGGERPGLVRTLFEQRAHPGTA